MKRFSADRAKTSEGEEGGGEKRSTAACSREKKWKMEEDGRSTIRHQT